MRHKHTHAYLSGKVNIPSVKRADRWSTFPCASYSFMSVYLSICWPFLLVHVFVCLFVCLYVLPMKPFWGQESYASCHWTLSPPVFLIGFLLSLTSLVSNFSDAQHLAITGAILRTCFYFMKTMVKMNRMGARVTSPVSFSSSSVSSSSYFSF